ERAVIELCVAIQIPGLLAENLQLRTFANYDGRFTLSDARPVPQELRYRQSRLRIQSHNTPQTKQPLQQMCLLLKHSALQFILDLLPEGHRQNQYCFVG